MIVSQRLSVVLFLFFLHLVCSGSEKTSSADGESVSWVCLLGVAWSNRGANCPNRIALTPLIASVEWRDKGSCVGLCGAPSLYTRVCVCLCIRRAGWHRAIMAQLLIALCMGNERGTLAGIVFTVKLVSFQQCVSPSASLWCSDAIGFSTSSAVFVLFCQLSLRRSLWGGLIRLRSASEWRM